LPSEIEEASALMGLTLFLSASGTGHGFFCCNGMKPVIMLKIKTPKNTSNIVIDNLVFILFVFCDQLTMWLSSAASE
jgi:hypothetical protein